MSNKARKYSYQARIVRAIIKENQKAINYCTDKRNNHNHKTEKEKPTPRR